MKWLFVTLLLVNAGFFAYMQLAGRPSGESLEAHAPINDDKIKVLPNTSPGSATPTPTP